MTNLQTLKSTNKIQKFQEQKARQQTTIEGIIENAHKLERRSCGPFRRMFLST